MMRLGLVAGCLAMTVLVACVDLPDDQPNYGSTEGLTFEEFKARTYREPGTGLYVLDWDTPVSGDAELYKIWESTVQGGLIVYNISGQDIVWSATQRKSLTYCVSNSFGANKATVVAALQTASDDGWEMLTDVDFIYVPAQDANCNSSNNNVMFDVNPTDSMGQYLARSFFPNSPRSERNVLVDNTVFTQGTGGPPFANILAHELGHVLGLRHEHIRPEANATSCAEDTEYRTLTTYDSASVMHYPQCNGTSADMSFTTRDQQGIVALYGAPGSNTSPMTQVNSPADGATVGPSFTVDAAIVDTDLVKAELYVDGTVAQTLTAGPFTFQVSNLAVGTHDLEVVATDGNGQSTSRSLTVNVSADAGSGSDISQANGIGDDVSGGCSVGGHGGGAGSLALLGLAGLVATRRRRRR